MECPHCKYQHGLIETGDDIESVVGEHGEFWELCVKMTKLVEWEGKREATLRACPRCFKTFIGDD